jgi:hypothetical protein
MTKIFPTQMIRLNLESHAWIMLVNNIINLVLTPFKLLCITSLSSMQTQELLLFLLGYIFSRVLLMDKI